MARSLHRPAAVAFVGFGEAAQAIVSGWGASRPDEIVAYDIKTDDPETAASMLQSYDRHGVRGLTLPAELPGDVDCVFCLVTADQAVVAAAAAAQHLSDDVLWFDGNSCAPSTKQQAGKIIDAQRGRYVDMAVMAPVHPARHRVPLRVSGPEVDVALDLLTALGMNAGPAGEQVGQASSIKMIRSVMIKGLEALTAECFLAARRAGVLEDVLASLEASNPEMGWRERGSYNLERMLQHGERRAAEMREVVRTLDDLELSSGMSSAATDWQALLGHLGPDAGMDDIGERTGFVLSKL